MQEKPIRPANDNYITAISVEEFCRSVGIGKVKFYSELKAGRIRAKKCGRRTLVPLSEVGAWFENLPAAGGE
ncbi:excisionase family DNA-binding protein [Sneathiella sp. HT1-7]|uniref:excisionase family DNA-binding protein n=1 Tax=Sneathiella sp. HT1-7 TaxID=2887192 RepID=UPI001D1431C8|nr:excisionase family DNA-binding protein [Sneathiella sp. HT1-7]